MENNGIQIIFISIKHILNVLGNKTRSHPTRIAHKSELLNKGTINICGLEMKKKKKVKRLEFVNTSGLLLCECNKCVLA